jgi:hypothetical protein
MMAGMLFVHSKIFLLLAALSMIAEGATRLLPTVLRKYFSVDVKFSVNTTVCNLAGIVIFCRFLGNFTGTLLWELIAGRLLLPRNDGMGWGLLILAGVAVLRVVCGFSMVILTIHYIL